MTAIDLRWVAFVDVDDRSGALTATTECFSTRGVSFDAVNTLDVHAGSGSLVFVFRGSERIARNLARTLGRLTSVRRVRLAAADDPSVRGLAQVHLPAGVEPTAIVSGGLDTVTRAGDGAWLFSGSLAAVEGALGAARGLGATGVACTVLPPR